MVVLVGARVFNNEERCLVARVLVRRGLWCRSGVGFVVVVLL